MKVAQLAFSLSNRAGGIFEILLGQSHALRNLGVGVQALGLEDDLWSKDRERWGAVPASVFSVQGPRFFGYAPGFSSGLEKANPELCHLHSLWMYPGVAMERWSRKNGRPYMVTPNGMLEPWALRNSGWKKRLAGLFYENAMLRGSACLQANTLKEADDFRAYGLKNRIEIVPNGVEVPEGSFKFSDLSFQNRGKKRLVFLGRIHPKKGLVGALRAWADIQNSKSKIQNSKQWQFVIAGWDQGGHEAELRALCADLGLNTAFRTTKDTNIHENIQPRIARIYTDKTEAQGGAWASQAGAAFSNPSTSQLARDCENTSPTRSASAPAGALFADHGEMGSVGGNQLADSKEFLDGHLQAGLQMDNQKGPTIRTANDPTASGEYSSSVKFDSLDPSRLALRADLRSLHLTPAPALDCGQNSDALDAVDVVFYGPAFGEEKEALLRSAEAFILPSFSEGLPMSVLEAWSYGLPVVMTPECNLPEGFACGAALEILNSSAFQPSTSHSQPATQTKLDSDWEGLRSLIEMTDAQRWEMGMRGRKLVEGKFTWPKVAKSLKEIYESLL
jgi:glycosyltransferase involved in cell wall biosynthesis